MAGIPDDVAKIAAYREAFARKEIMVELQSAVQLYARHVPATQA
jgi:hypothetical protein